MIFCVLLIILNTLVIKKTISGSNVHLLLKILIFVSYFGWNALPLLLSFLPAMKGFLIADYTSYIECNIINQIYLLLVYLLSLHFLSNKPIIKLFIKKDFQDNDSFIKKIGFICFFILLYNIYYQFSVGGFYLDRNDIDSSLGSDSGFTRYFMCLGTYGVLIIILFYRSLFSRKMLLLMIFALVFYYLYVAFSGGRINLFAVVIIFLYYAYEKKKKSLVLGVIFLVFFAIALLPSIAYFRGQNTKNVDLDGIISEASFDYVILMHELLNKTNSVESSSFLISHDGVGGGGIQVYTSTLFTLIPRSIYPSKPQPGSKDGTITGLPSRLAAIYIRGGDYNGISNVGISPSIEALWAGGWIMYIIQIIVSAYSIFVMNSLIFGRKFLFLYFMFIFIGFPICMLDVSLVAILRDLPRFIIAYWIMSKAFKVFLVSSKKTKYLCLKEK